MSGNRSQSAFSMCEAELNGIVQDYLEYVQLSETLEKFQNECELKNKMISIAQASGSNQQAKVIQNKMVQLFNYGKRAEFFHLWFQEIPRILLEDDDTARRLEFQLHIYFAVWVIRNSHDKKEKEVALVTFKQYIETRGAKMSQVTDFLTYFALPFVPDPSNHPSYKELFTDDWSLQLQKELEGFLAFALETTPFPKLLHLYKFGMNSNDFEKQLKDNEAKLTEAEQKTITYMRRFNKLQSDYHKLIGITADLVDSLEASIQGDQIQPEYVQSICRKLFASSNIISSQDSRADLSRPGTAGNLLRASITVIPIDSKTTDIVEHDDIVGDESANDLMELDFEKIKSELSGQDERMQGLLLQALRWRLTRSAPGNQRDGILESYIKGDILEIELSRTLLKHSNPMIRQYTSRLINSMASMYVGRKYMAGSKEFLIELKDDMMKEEADFTTKENQLGALQKLSLRKNVQTELINSGLILWLVKLLEDVDNLSDYSLEYSVALLMNLCLRTSGKCFCADNDPKKILQVLIDLLGHENFEIKPYVNGALYSILSHQVLREHANSIGMEEMLRCFMSDDQPDMNRQIGFIISQLKSQEEIDPGVISDDDDDDDEDDQDAMEADLDKVELLKPIAGELNGDELLATYAKSGTSSRLLEPSRKKRLSEITEVSTEGVSSPVTKQVDPDASEVLSEIVGKPKVLIAVDEERESKSSISDEYKMAFGPRSKVLRTPGPRLESSSVPVPDVHKTPTTVREHSKSVMEKSYADDFEED